MSSLERTLRIDTVEKLEAAARGFQLSRLILTAVELDLFSALLPEGAEAGSVAERLNTDLRATEMLLHALAAVGLLEKHGAIFRCAPFLKTALDRDSGRFLKAMLQHGVHLWETWSQLTETVRRGGPELPRAGFPISEKRLAEFIGAMHYFGLEQQAAFVEAIDWRGVRRVLDLGGGSGVFSIAFCRANPEIEATLFDQPAVITLAEKYVRDAGLLDRIHFRRGDMLEDDIGGGWDLVWLSNVIHSMGPEAVRALFHKVAGALHPGGRLVLRDFILEDDRIQPPGGALFALNMLVNTPSGRCYTRSELWQWLQDAGLENPRFRQVDTDTATRLLIVDRPGT